MDVWELPGWNNSLSDQIIGQLEAKAKLIEDAFKGVASDEGLTKESKQIQEQFKSRNSGQVIAPTSGYK